MKDRPHPGWPSTGCAHGSAHWPGRPPARSWCAAGRAPAPIGPRRGACAPRPPTAGVSPDRTSMRPNPPHSQVTTDELLAADDDQDLDPATAALSKSRQWVLAALRAGEIGRA